MKSYGVEMEPEVHISHVVESCIRCHKVEKLEQIEKMCPQGKLPSACLPGAIRLLGKYNKAHLALKYYEELRAQNLKLE
jgi:hypothetical protein